MFNQGRSQEFIKGEANQGIWGTEVPSGVQRQNMETLENINGDVTKIDLRGHKLCTHVPPLATPLCPVLQL